MKKVKLLLSGLAVFALMAFTTSQAVWNLDNAHSDFGFSITHMGISDITGTFNDFSATITGDEKDLTKSVVEAKINVASINTRIEARDGHLKSPEFFDAEQYPEMTFKSTKITKKKNGAYKVVGDLTAKGVTKEVELELTHRGTIEHPQTKKMVSGYKITGTIERLTFGIGSGFPAAMLSDEVQITVNGQFQNN